MLGLILGGLGTLKTAKSVIFGNLKSQLIQFNDNWNNLLTYEYAMHLKCFLQLDKNTPTVGDVSGITHVPVIYFSFVPLKVLTLTFSPLLGLLDRSA